MMRSSRWLAVLLLPGIGLPLCESQSSGKSFDHLPAADRQLLSVKVSGTKRYSDEAVIAASGLQMGTTVVEDDFKKAARRLGDLGVFADIAYSYSYSSAGTKLALQVTDADKFVPVRFEDF
jgi:outer membrane protein assembly factor BamA